MTNSNPKNKQTLSRRQAIKTIVAATGAATLFQIPPTWQTPIIQVDILPAHAQSSDITTLLTISNPQGVNTGTNDCAVTAIGSGSSFKLIFDYTDTSGSVTTSSVVLYKTSTAIAPGTPVDEIPLNMSKVQLTGNSFSGTITLPWCQIFSSGADTVDFEFQLKNDRGTVSNAINLTITRPVGGNSQVQYVGGVSQ